MMRHVNQQHFDRAAYALAKDFLLRSGAERGVTPELIEKYLHLSRLRPESLAGLYERMLESAQSGNMNAGVVGGPIGGVGNLGPVLCDFDPARVLERSTPPVGKESWMTSWPNSNLRAACLAHRGASGLGIVGLFSPVPGSCRGSPRPKSSTGGSTSSTRTTGQGRHYRCFWHKRSRGSGSPWPATS